MANQRLEPSPAAAETKETVVEGAFHPGTAPLKVVTGTQTTSSLNFELKPGAIVAHPNSTVIFVCG